MKAFDWQRMALDKVPVEFLAEVALRSLYTFVLVFIFLRDLRKTEFRIERPPPCGNCCLFLSFLCEILYLLRHRSRQNHTCKSSYNRNGQFLCYLSCYTCFSFYHCVSSIYHCINLLLILLLKLFTHSEDLYFHS